MDGKDITGQGLPGQAAEAWWLSLVVGSGESLRAGGGGGGSRTGTHLGKP